MEAGQQALALLKGQESGALAPLAGDAVATLMKLIETLEDDDDVQNVYSNADISAEDLEKLAG